MTSDCKNRRSRTAPLYNNWSLALKFPSLARAGTFRLDFPTYPVTFARVFESI